MNAKAHIITSLFFLLIVMLLPMRAVADDVFSELAGFPDVESSYVSGRFAHNQKYWQSASGGHSMNLGRGFSALYSYQCYSKQSVAKARSILDSYLKKNPDIEMVMRTKQSSNEYVIYEKFGKDGLLYQMIIWSLDSPQVCEIVVVDWKDGLRPGEDTRYGEKDRSWISPNEMHYPLNSLKIQPLL